MSLQSALIGYLISLLFPQPMSPQENVVLQTTAVATGLAVILYSRRLLLISLLGTMPLAAGFVGIIPALGLLDINKDGVPPIHLTWLHGVGWSLAVAFFGYI